MSIVTNVITPIIQMMAYVFMGGGFLYLLWRIMKSAIPNLSLILKYKIFKKQYRESDVEWCMDAVHKDMDNIAVKKILLINGTPKKKVNEMLFILNDVRIEIKGGLK